MSQLTSAHTRALNELIDCKLRPLFPAGVSFKKAKIEKCSCGSNQIRGLKSASLTAQLGVVSGLPPINNLSKCLVERERKRSMSCRLFVSMA
jgi:hypothetical protein